jgi:hypothetical protein
MTRKPRKLERWEQLEQREAHRDSTIALCVVAALMLGCGLGLSAHGAFFLVVGALFFAAAIHSIYRVGSP